MAAEYDLKDVGPYNHVGAQVRSPMTRHSTADLQRVISNVEQYYFEKEQEADSEAEVMGQGSGHNKSSGRRDGSGFGDRPINNLFNIDPVFGDPKYNRPACNDGKSKIRK